jgi:hypothetical protein
MHNHRFSTIDRRRFLGFGALAGVFCALGCEGTTEPSAVTTPPTVTGNRKHLDMLKEKGQQTPTSKKK